MSAPAIGALRRHFALEAPVVGADGGLVHELRFLAWGALELNAAGATIHLRDRSAIMPGWRLRLGERAFDITAVQRDGTASGFIACLCREIAS